MNTQTFIAGLLGITAVLAVVLGKRKPLRWPLAAIKINDPFGPRTNPVTGQAQLHNGVDLAATVGTVVAAPADGTVTALYTDDTGGNQLVITHDNGYKTGYAHLSRYAVSLNQKVVTSQVIAFTGATGHVTGPHLHFTVRDTKNMIVNPAEYCS